MDKYKEIDEKLIQLNYDKITDKEILEISKMKIKV